MEHLHGDEIISGVENKVEDKPSYKGPGCGYTVTEKKGDVTTTKKCGSQEIAWNVTGEGKWTGRERTDPVCAPHFEKAFKEWKIRHAEKLNSAPKD